MIRRSQGEDDVPEIGGYYLVLGQQRIRNLYEGASTTNPCGNNSLEIIQECFVIKATQKDRFVTLEIMNQPICPILCAIVRDYSGSRLVGWKLVGSGGNTSSNYTFDIVRQSGNVVNKLEYYFTDGFNRPGAPFVNGIATTGFGIAKRVRKSEVPELVKRFPGGSCDVIL